MKLVFCDDSNLILFLNNMTIPKVDFEDREELEEYFRALFLKLKDVYQVVIQGYYNIDIYIDSFYGAVIEIEKEELDYFEYDDNQVDMRICIHQTSILYELEEYIPLNPKEYDMIWYGNKWYAKLKQKVNDIYLGRLLEHSDIHYQEENEQILRRGIYLERY